MTRPERGWTLTAGTAAAAALGVLAAASLGTTSTERALAAAPPTAAGCLAPQISAPSKSVGTSWENTNGPGTSSVITVAPGAFGAGAKVSDVDVSTFIQSTAPGDHTITISHGGRTVNLVTRRSTRRAWDANNDIFNGTRFDDSAGVAVMTLTPAQTPVEPASLTAVSPHGKLSAFNGMDPSGDWTITVRDDRTTEAEDLPPVPGDPPPPPPPPGAPNPEDQNTFASWQLALSATPDTAKPPVSPQINVASTGGPLPIPSTGAATANKTMVVSAAPGQRVTEISLDTNTPHALTSDMLVTLVGPGGREVVISPGGGIVPRFASQTSWSDGATNPLVPVSLSAGAGDGQNAFQPHQSLNAFIGDEANGTWTLKVRDRFDDSDNGTLNGATLKIRTSGGCANDLEVSAPNASVPVNTARDVVYTVRNNSAAAGSNGVAVNFTPADGLSVVGAPTTAAGTCVVSPTLRCTLRDLGPGESTTVTVRAQSAVPGALGLTAAVSAAQADTNPANNTATATTTFVDPNAPTPNPPAGPTQGTPNAPTARLTLSLGATRFSVRRGAVIRTRLTLSSAARVTVQLKKGKRVVKRAVLRGRKGRNVLAFRVVRATGAYRLVVIATPTGGRAVTRTVNVTIRR